MKLSKFRPELSGTLVRENNNIIVTSQSAANAKAQRYARIHAQAIELLAREANTGNGQGAAQQPPAASEPLSMQISAAPTDGAPLQEPPSVGWLLISSVAWMIRPFKSRFRCSRRLLLTFLRSACRSLAYWQWSRPACFWAGVLRKSSPPGRGSTYPCFGT